MGKGKRKGLVSYVKNLKLGDLGEAVADIGAAAAAVGSFFLNEEIKRFDVSHSDATDWNGSVFGLSQIAEGNDYNNRDGLSIKTEAIEARLSSYRGSFDASTRFIIFTDLENQGAAPTPGDVLENVNFGTQLAILAPFNHTNTERFVVLYDTTVVVDLNESVIQLKARLPLSMHIRYGASAGAAASGREGQLWILRISDLPAMTAPTMAYHNRIQYFDN